MSRRHQWFIDELSAYASRFAAIKARYDRAPLRQSTLEQIRGEVRHALGELAGDFITDVKVEDCDVMRTAGDEP